MFNLMNAIISDKGIMRKVIISTILVLLIIQPLSIFAQGTNYRFTGQEFDQEINLHNFKAREYSSETGRFLQQDPVLKDGEIDHHFLNTASQEELVKFLSDPQRLNSYSYTNNNPIVYVDPNGEAGMPFQNLFSLMKNFPNSIGRSVSNQWQGIKQATNTLLDFTPFGDVSILARSRTLNGEKVGAFGKGLALFGLVGGMTSKVGNNVIKRLSTKLDVKVAERVASNVENGIITFSHGTKDYFRTIQEGIHGKVLHFTDDASLANKYGLRWSGLDALINGGVVQWKFPVDEFINYLERGLIEIDPKDINGFRSFSKEVINKVNNLIIK